MMPLISNMLTSATREKLEDMKWREEVLGLLEVATKQYQHTFFLEGLTEMQLAMKLDMGMKPEDLDWKTLRPYWKDKMEKFGEESKRIKERIETFDYVSLQIGIDKQCRFRGCTDVHKCWRYGI